MDPSCLTDAAEWLEADGLGGFASGTVLGVRTRRYHALLLSATTPPTGRQVLVNGVDAWLESLSGVALRVPLTAHYYAPGVFYPGDLAGPPSFAGTPWPTWTYALPDGTHLCYEILVSKSTGATLLRWSLATSTSIPTPTPTRWRLCVRPLLSGRDYHALHHENAAFDFAATTLGADGASVCWRPYPGVASTMARSNGRYSHQPDWYRHFLYAAEQERGLDCVEDLATPGLFSYELSSASAAVLVLQAGEICDTAGTSGMPGTPDTAAGVAVYADRLAADESARRAALRATAPGTGIPPALIMAADSYLAARGNGSTLLAGFPWFTDWGRDTFIAMRGLLLATGRYPEARAILLEWASTLSAGMLPNRFPDAGAAPEFNSVDASLWFIVAVHDYLAVAQVPADPASVRERLGAAVEAILNGYADGTRYRIKAENDGLLAAGEAGMQLTWMDAKVGDDVITPRIGKPVEVQALWINALAIGARLPIPGASRWAALENTARQGFVARFINPQDGTLYDVIDVDHVPGALDASLRPNQVFALGGLPFRLLDQAAACRIVDRLEAQLLTPRGLRSLAPGDPAYHGHYLGGPGERDRAYHQGTVWPWLSAAFVDAWLYAHGTDPAARETAARRFLAPLLAALAAAGPGQVSELADGDAPHASRGCPFQAWSLGELIRTIRMLA